MFGPGYWGADGNWRFEVVGAGGDGEVVFADVAAAHPLLQKWEAVVQAEAKRYGVDWDVLKDEDFEGGSDDDDDDDRGEGEDGKAGQERGGRVRRRRDAGSKPVSRAIEALAW